MLQIMSDYVRFEYFSGQHPMDRGLSLAIFIFPLNGNKNERCFTRSEGISFPNHPKSVVTCLGKGRYYGPCGSLPIWIYPVFSQPEWSQRIGFPHGLALWGDSVCEGMG